MISRHRDVALRQITEDDMPFLFRLFADPRRCHLWMRSRQVHDERGFHQAWVAWTSDSIAAKFLVEAAGRPVGLVFDYDRTLEDGYTKLTALLQEENAGHGSGVIAAALLTDLLFQTLPFRKIYHEVYAYNAQVLRMHRKIGLVEEAVLRETRFWNGVYWDAHLFALSREAWPAIRDRLLRPPPAARETPPVDSRVPLNGCLNRAE
jgi:RimJ/RimL family protein N-acetyltransferase